MRTQSYVLEPYKGLISRHICPKCKKPNVFSRYVDAKTGNMLHPDIGRCNRENNCGYHRTPRQYFEDHPTQAAFIPNLPAPANTIPVNDPSDFPVPLFKKSLREYNRNHFVSYLISLFGQYITRGLISQYFIGTSRHWEGATVFWQIDGNGKIRTGKIMLYNPETGKRVKEPFSHITWAHKAARLSDFSLRQGLFGEHLLNRDPHKPVGIVESEKTAIIASIYLPDFTWLAAGSLNNLNPSICKPLKNRSVTLFPDLSGYEKWRLKADELNSLGLWNVSGLLERNASEAEKNQGLDLADYLTRFKYQEFVIEPSLPTTLTPNPSEGKFDFYKLEPIEVDGPSIMPHTCFAPEDWGQEISELEKFFSTHSIPEAPISIPPFMIVDIQRFIGSHLALIKSNNGNPTFRPYLDRLRTLQLYLL